MIAQHFDALAIFVKARHGYAYAGLGDIGLIEAAKGKDDKTDKADLPVIKTTH